MVALTSEQQSKTKFYLEYNLATPAADLARLQRAMTEIPDTWTLTRIGDLISRCDDAYELLELAAGALTSDEQTAITGDVVRTTVTANRDSYNRRQRYFLDCTSYLAKALGVRNFRDPEQVAAAHFIDGGLYINSIPGVDGNDGLSAYDVAVENGFEGTEQEWLDSLARDAYQVAVDNGFVGTEQDWLDSLVGPQGDEGPQGATGSPGAGIDWKGPWNSGTAYIENDGVGYNGSAYIANAANTNKTPGVDPEWDLWVAKGDTGATGPSTPLNPAVFPHIATPSDPGAGNTSLYAKTDGKLYYRPTGGSETEVGSGSGGREVLTANRTYYVRTDGSNSNNGLDDTAGGAFLTIQKALDVVGSLDISVYDVTIQVGAGTYNEALVYKSPIGFGSGGNDPVYLKGDLTTPSNVVINATGSCIYANNTIVPLSVGGFKLVATASGIISAGKPTFVRLYQMEFGAITSFAIYGLLGGTIALWNTATISGSCSRFIYLKENSFFRTWTGMQHTITLTGTPAWGSAFCYVEGNSTCNVLSLPFTGSATGKRYEVLTSSVLMGTGGSTTYLPGSINGTVDALTYGVYA
jgi:hypothetical protein